MRLLLPLVSFWFALVCLTGCQSLAYNALQESERSKCLESTQGAALDECLQRQETSFHDFKNQREQSLEER
ncbi:hypothetical protein [Marinagarivorans cellulosilyticus]|uniref:hypothetical protein n=1 Tax=Marinagarivorans cellulosilyticus TaxID=2721545 RepID=UPI001F15CBD1|nr:hypothetical protein [Marinagarivorans cellulosilyticus]